MSTHVDPRPSTLRLGWEVQPGHENWPSVTITIDGANPIEELAPGWLGFDPGKVFVDDSPMLPAHPPRRVAIWRCRCGEAGCGVIAPMIGASADGLWVEWWDPRDYVGSFIGPISPQDWLDGGRAWNLPAYRFDRHEYLTEVARAVADRSWETLSRATARLLSDRLRGTALPGGLAFRWAAPNRENAYSLSYESAASTSSAFAQQILLLRTVEADPAAAAQDMVEQLLAVDLYDRVRTFGRTR